LGAAGLSHPRELTAMHLLRRISAHEVKTFAELHTFLGERELLGGTGHAYYAQAWTIAHAGRFTVQPEVQATAEAQGQAA
jgi:ABC-type Zn2+ transport system substrate-binding protein/surface adhesin